MNSEEPKDKMIVPNFATLLVHTMSDEAWDSVDKEVAEAERIVREGEHG